MSIETVRDVSIADDRQEPTRLLGRRVWTVLVDGQRAELRLRVARGRLVGIENPPREEPA